MYRPEPTFMPDHTGSLFSAPMRSQSGIGMVNDDSCTVMIAKSFDSLKLGKSQSCATMHKFPNATKEPGKRIPQK